MVDEIHDVISTFFQRRKSYVSQFAFSTFFQRRFNVVKVIFNVGSTLKQRHFAHWGVCRRAMKTTILSLSAFYDQARSQDVKFGWVETFLEEQLLMQTQIGNTDAKKKLGVTL